MHLFRLALLNTIVIVHATQVATVLEVEDNMLTAPFQIDDLKKIVSGDIKAPVIDFANSKLKDQSLLTYIYNLNLSDAIVDMTGSPLEQRRNFFLSYANHKTTVEVAGMSETYIKFLLELKNIKPEDEDLEDLSPAIFTDDEVKTLLETDQELRDAIEHAAFILDGIVVHIMLSMNNVSMLGDEEFGKVGVLRDPNWVGHTWINLLKNPVFNSYYYRVMPPLSELVYFPYQYSEAIYKGKVLFDYLDEHPWIAAFMQVGVDKLREKTE
jgi:hypothetical protein